MPGNYFIGVWGDWHVYNNAVAYSSINDFKRVVLSRKNYFAVLGGDLTETIVPFDKRFSFDAHTDKKDGQGVLPDARIQKQRDFVVELCKPLADADRLLWLLQGNHEARVMNSYGDITADIVKDLGLPKDCNGGYVCKADMGSFKIYDWHGNGMPPRGFAGDARQNKTNKEIWLKRRLRKKCADCEVMLMHHIHQVVIHPPVEELIMVDNGQKLKSFYTKTAKIDLDNGMFYIPEELRWYASSGTALRSQGDGWESYAEVYGLDPTDIAYIEIEVRNDKVKSIVKKTL